jgi:hypothetical protein
VYDARQEQDLTRACRRYKRSLKAGTVRVRADGDTQAQYTHYREARERTRAHTGQIRELLYQRGAAICLLASYCNFTKHLGRVCREYDAATLRHLVQMALDRWTAKGLDRDVLLAIAEEVFGVGV